MLAVDSSRGNIVICQQRGVKNAIEMDFHHMEFASRSFGAIICMGNTLGIGQSRDSFPVFMGDLRALVKPKGRLVASVIDPLKTEDSVHLAYHERNRAVGRPPGLVRARLRYRGHVSDWWHLYLATEEEFEAAAILGGWVIESMEREGGNMVWALRKK